MNTTGLRVIDFSEIELARQLTLIDSAMFRRIKPNEWMMLGQERNTKYINAPNILKMITRFNRLSRWVCTCIVQEKEMLPRAKIMKRFSEVALVRNKA